MFIHPNFTFDYRHVSETGSLAVQSMDCGRPLSARTPGHEELILQTVENGTGNSTVQDDLTM